ncbi:MAG TPA: YicC family protein [Clostridia bacterium]|nr:YicC family protein [Clostridia bacterium]
MIRSMTGFGKGTSIGPGYIFSIEIKSVNHRFCEVVVRLPRQLSALESRIKAEVQKRVNRGRLDVYLNYEPTEEREKRIKFDKKLAVAYYQTFQEIEKELGLNNVCDVQFLARMPEVLTIEEQEWDEEEYWHYCAEALEQALSSLQLMKENEGRRLAEDLNYRIGLIEKLVQEIELNADTVVNEYRNKLEDRIKELLPNNEIDFARLATEVVLFAERSNITEELVRLSSHLRQFKQDLSKGGAVGRKFDFIIQEMNREVNTIGSKANNYFIASRVVELKSELEKIREQVQNIE